MKDKDGQLIEFTEYGKLWSDGSISFDVPTERLLEDFNVKFTIAIQCNAHSFAFYYDEFGSINNPVKHSGYSALRGGFVVSLIEKYLKLELKKWMKLIGEFELIPQLFGKNWRFTAIQDSRGSIS